MVKAMAISESIDKYVLLMDEEYTICEDWGEGSGLQVRETDCNEADPGEEQQITQVTILSILLSFGCQELTYMYIVHIFPSVGFHINIHRHTFL